MSIKLMSAIFETEFRDLPYNKDGEERKAKASTAKLLLLAIADHANDYGESAYPGYDKLEIKTALSRQGIADTLDALKQNGLIVVSDEPSRLGTNDYSININAFPKMTESSHLTSASQATLPTGVKPLDLNHPLTINKPSIPLSIENAIAADQPVTEEMVRAENLRDVAPKMFERALGFSKPLPWWSNKDWTAFGEWVCDRYLESKTSFGEYNIWRATPYTKGAMANTRIRGFITEFYDSWDMFMMSQKPKTDETRPEYQPFPFGDSK